MTARTTLFKSDDYSLHATLVPIISPKGGFALTFTSQRLAVRHPSQEHMRFFGCFEPEGLQALADLIQKTLTEEPQGGHP